MVLALVCTPWTQIPGDNADGAGMVAHLHAFLGAGDLLYDDEYAALHMSPLFAFVTEEGLVSNHWPFGATLLQAPGWLLGRLGARLSADLVSARAVTWVLPVLGLRTWACLAGLWLLGRVYLWLRGRGVGRGPAILGCAALGLGTPLLYYATEAPTRPHLWGAIVVAELVMRWLDAMEAETDSAGEAGEWASLIDAVVLASLAGLATAIRPQLAPLCALVAAERLGATRGKPWTQRLKLLAIHGGMTAVIWSLWPALIVRSQLWMYGDIGASVSGAGVDTHLRAFLLSTHHGALIWCPVLVVGVLGLAVGLAQRERGAGLLLALLALQIWLDAGTREIEPFSVLGTRTWTGGTAFGPRKLLDAAPLMLPGIVWLTRWLDGLDPGEAQRWRRRLGAATILAIVPTVLLSIAAWLEPRVTSEILDGERLTIAMSLPFDPANWSHALATRALPLRVSATMAVCVGLPLAVVVVAGLAAQQGRDCRELGGEPDPSPSAPERRGGLALALVAVLASVSAHGVLSRLQHRSELLLKAQPQRMPTARASMNPWHEATVQAIPGHHALLRARLGADAVD